MPFGLDLSEVEPGKTIKADHVFPIYELLTGERSPGNNFEFTVDGPIKVSGENRADKFELENYQGSGNINQYVGGNLQNAITDIVLGDTTIGTDTTLESKDSNIVVTDQDDSAGFYDYDISLTANFEKTNISATNYLEGKGLRLSSANENALYLGYKEPNQGGDNQVNMVTNTNSIAIAVDDQDENFISGNLSSSNNPNPDYTKVVTFGKNATTFEVEARFKQDVILNYTSDVREKINVSPIRNSNNIIQGISGYTFEWKDEEKRNLYGNKKEYGVIAQELKEVMPEAVVEREDGTLAVNYKSLIPVIIEKLKLQQEEIDSLKNQNSKN
jgi:hypothetical protein